MSAMGGSKLMGCGGAFAMVAFGAVFVANAWGQWLSPDDPNFLERCKSWIERKGYPVDYIEQKAGKRQPGFAPSWKGNVKPEDVRAGDVVIRRSVARDDGSSTVSAGYVESVEPAAGGSGVFVTLSAMGIGGKTWVDQECWVTDTFGQISQVRVPLSEVVRVWRPSLPLE